MRWKLFQSEVEKMASGPYVSFFSRKYPKKNLLTDMAVIGEENPDKRRVTSPLPPTRRYDLDGAKLLVHA